MTAINLVYCFSSGTRTCNMMMHSVTIGPAAPCSKRPTSSTVTFGASAETVQPATVNSSIPISTFLRPIRSAKRGRNSENNAAEVKKTVCDKPIWVAVVFSSLCIVTKAGDNMEAFVLPEKISLDQANPRLCQRDTLKINRFGKDVKDERMTLAYRDGSVMRFP